MEGKCRLAEIINCDLPAVIAHLLKDDSRSQEHKDNILNDINWLIERVQELEEHSIEAKEDYEYLSYHYGNAVEQNRRYREALEFINEELELVLHSNKGLAEKMFYIENSKRKITEALEGESNE